VINGILSEFKKKENTQHDKILLKYDELIIKLLELAFDYNHLIIDEKFFFMLLDLYSKYEKKKILGLMLKTDKFQKNETDKTRNKFIENLLILIF
jgi:hypothetical protein